MFASRKNNRTSRTSRPQTTRQGKPTFEMLEDRRHFSVYTVTNTLHSGTPIRPVPQPETDYFAVSVSPSAVTAGSPCTVTVTEYAYATGKVVSGVGGASLALDVDGTDTPLPAITLSNGTGTEVVTLTKAENAFIFATSGSLISPKTYITGGASVVVNPAAASKFVLSAPFNATNGVQFDVDITAEDKWGNIVPNYTDTPTITASDGQQVTLNSIDWSNGVGTAAVTLSEPDIVKLTVSNLVVTTSRLGFPIIFHVAVPETTGSIFVQGPSTTNSLWSGYASSPGSGVTAVGGTWVEPKVSGPGATSTWVGIDGYGGSTVEQIGVATSVVNGTTVYTPWVEFFGDTTGYKADGVTPTNPGKFFYQTSLSTLGSTLSVHPGDTISGAVSLVQGTNNTFLLQMTDKPASGGAVEVFSTTQTLQYVVPNLGTAEWIVENPNGGLYPGTKTPQPLADFGQVGFSGCWATVNSSTSGINGLANLTALNLSSPVAQDVTTDPPSLLNTLGYNEPANGLTSSSFDVTWV
jgi:hypothetical protein